MVYVGWFVVCAVFYKAAFEAPFRYDLSVAGAAAWAALTVLLFLPAGHALAVAQGRHLARVRIHRYGFVEFIWPALRVGGALWAANATAAWLVTYGFSERLHREIFDWADRPEVLAFVAITFAPVAANLGMALFGTWHLHQRALSAPPGPVEDKSLVFKDNSAALAAWGETMAAEIYPGATTIGQVLAFPVAEMAAVQIAVGNGEFEIASAWLPEPDRVALDDLIMLYIDGRPNEVWDGFALAKLHPRMTVTASGPEWEVAERWKLPSTPETA